MLYNCSSFLQQPFFFMFYAKLKTPSYRNEQFTIQIDNEYGFRNQPVAIRSYNCSKESLNYDRFVDGNLKEVLDIILDDIYFRSLVVIVIWNE